MDIRPIHNDDEYRAALKMIERLWDATEGSKDADALEVLSILVEKYEQEHYPIDPPDPVEAILFRMEQQGISRKQLEEIIGKSRTTEVLKRQRPLTLGQIRKLCEAFGIPAEVLIREYSTARAIS
jgi:HTH-type transcriptional regulator / antitoxin HigA